MKTIVPNTMRNQTKRYSERLDSIKVDNKMFTGPVAVAQILSENLIDLNFIPGMEQLVKNYEISSIANSLLEKNKMLTDREALDKATDIYYKTTRAYDKAIENEINVSARIMPSLAEKHEKNGNELDANSVIAGDNTMLEDVEERNELDDNNIIADDEALAM